MLQEETKAFHDLLKANRLIEYLNKYRKIVMNNIRISSQYNDIIKNLILILRYNELLKEKDSLLKELELSSQYKKSSDVAAITDLLNKLNVSLALNKKKLKLFEEDYFRRKNQNEQIKKTLNDLNSKIQQLNNQKKNCFSQINRITREMEGDTQESKNDTKMNIIQFNNSVSNAEKIKTLQKKAKEIQSEISNITLIKNQTQIKLKELNPIFKNYESDYQSLLEIVKNDEKRIKNLQIDLKNKIKDNNTTEIKEDGLADLKSLRSVKEIDINIEKIDYILKKVRIAEKYFNHQNPSDLSPIIRKLTEFNNIVENNDSEIIINLSEKEITNSFNQFKELDNSLTNIELLINKFLSEINIRSQIRIILSDNNNNFLMNLEFIRKNKEKVKFEDLTTPEKIFFIIVFYISILLYVKKDNIVFSNVSILNSYNKAGSIFRVIRKILPIFEKEDVLSEFNLIFIISNLELKKDIKNLKVITLEE